MGTSGLSHRFTVLGMAVIAFFCLTRQENYAAQCPCDIYQVAGTPCVAAHSTVRQLLSTYTGPLYQVKRLSDNATKDIPQLPNGIANASVQDSFLGTGTHVGTISIIYDQSGRGNNLKKANVCSTCSGCPGDGSKKGQPDIEAFADDAKIKINGYTAYGVGVRPCGGAYSNQVGYRLAFGAGMPTGDQPESEYYVVNGKNTNGLCCFDYGNASTNLAAGPNMSSIEFSSNGYWGTGAGSGPWVAADLEGGVYTYGGSGKNNNSISLPYDFVTAMDKNNSNGVTPVFTLKGGNAQSGALTTMWQGARPNGYASLIKQGGIVLGIGGDNAAGGKSDFYEGTIIAGVPANSVDDQIQDNIVAAGYGSTTTMILRNADCGKTGSLLTVHYNQSTACAVIGYTLPDVRRVSLVVYGQQGRQIATVASGIEPAGRREKVWNAQRVPSGVYVARVTFDRGAGWAEKIVIQK